MYLEKISSGWLFRLLSYFISVNCLSRIWRVYSIVLLLLSRWHLHWLLTGVWSDCSWFVWSVWFSPFWELLVDVNLTSILTVHPDRKLLLAFSAYIPSMGIIDSRGILSKARSFTPLRYIQDDSVGPVRMTGKKQEISFPRSRVVTNRVQIKLNWMINWVMT